MDDKGVACGNIEDAIREIAAATQFHSAGALDDLIASGCEVHMAGGGLHKSDIDPS